MNDNLALIVAFLNRARIRATYGAIGEVLETSAQAVGSALGDRRPEASWVVNAETGLPSGYTPVDYAENLQADPRIIRTGTELLRHMAGLDDSRVAEEDSPLVWMSDVSAPPVPHVKNNRSSSTLEIFGPSTPYGEGAPYSKPLSELATADQALHFMAHIASKTWTRSEKFLHTLARTLSESLE